MISQRGLSLEKIQTNIKIGFSINVSRTGILNWLKKANIPRRSKSSGNQKRKTVRERIDISVSTLIRFVSSQNPFKLLVLQTEVVHIGRARASG